MINNHRITRLTALMAAHGLTFLQVYSFYMEVAQAVMQPHLRLQVVVFGVVMLVGVSAAYAGLMIKDDERPLLRRGLEALSIFLLLSEWVVLGRAYLFLH